MPDYTEEELFELLKGFEFEITKLKRARPYHVGRERLAQPTPRQ